MIRRWTRLLLLASLVGATSNAWAQGPPLTVGTRVRVVLREPEHPRIGAYRGADQAGLTLGIDSTTLTIPRANIVLLEQSLGRKPGVPGGVVGALLGALAGGAVGCLANQDDYGVFCAGQDDTKVIVGAAVGGIVGAVLGAMIFRTERWRAIELPR